MPHTSGTALQDTCVYAVRPYTENLKLNEQIHRFQICARIKASKFTPMDLLNATEDSSPCNPTECERQIAFRVRGKATARLQHKENRKEGDQRRPR